ncbi:hypothetical protein V1525DRAFT_51278 [Lipomyces kononenkoae]|uniref:Uncharacterized protein n=1 Tax=Lipomyces kononenkoae TaxID=34357 RepID=A0ACC3SSG6_LIPKO
MGIISRVNSVSPGYMLTQLTNFADDNMRKEWIDSTPMARERLPVELVGANLYLASDASTYTTGSDIVRRRLHLYSLLAAVVIDLNDFD